MILADSSIWVDHFVSPHRGLMELVSGRLLCCHPAVVGELACLSMIDRQARLRLLKDLRQAPVVSHLEVLHFIEANRLMGSGIGYVDAHLLASVAALPGLIWTSDRPLRKVAERLGLSF